VKVGDLVARTYGEGQRPTAIIVGTYHPKNAIRSYPLVELIWTGRDRVVQFGSEHLEVISESR